MAEAAWPFTDPKNVAVFTTAAILAGSPILYVFRDDDDGSWQFMPGTGVAMADARLVSLYYITQLDSTIYELADLPCGWHAQRSAPDASWQWARMNNNSAQRTS